MEALKTIAVTACLITGRERAAIAIISLRGDKASELINQNFTPATLRKICRGDVRYGTWHGRGVWHGPEVNSENVVPSESVVIAYLHPTDTCEKGAGSFFGTSTTHHSKTVENWEIHCHGGAAAIQRILDDLSAAGATIVDSDDLLAIAGISELRQESLNALGHTTTIRTAAIVLDQVRGAMADFAYNALRCLDSEAEDAIDLIHHQAREILGLSEFGKHLTVPWSVVLAGSPNVGKSSLINAIVGYRRSITLDRPGTTRDVLHADAIIDGWPILLSDTAGIRTNPAESIEQQGIERARDALRRADLVLWIEDAADELSSRPPADLESTRRWLRVVNKIDLARQLPQLPAPQTIQTSATLGIGIDALRLAIVSKLIPEMPPAGFPVPIGERQTRILNGITSAENTLSLRPLLIQLRGH